MSRYLSLKNTPLASIHQILWRLILCHILKVETGASHIRAQLSLSTIKSCSVTEGARYRLEVCPFYTNNIRVSGMKLVSILDILWLQTYNLTILIFISLQIRIWITECKSMDDREFLRKEEDFVCSFSRIWVLEKETWRSSVLM